MLFETELIMGVTVFAADALILNYVSNHAVTVDNCFFRFTFASFNEFLSTIQLAQVVLLFHLVSFELSEEWVVAQNPRPFQFVP